MSLDFKSTLSMAAVLASSLTFVACAKNSDSPKAAAAAIPQTVAQVVEAKEAAADMKCPDVIGTYQDVVGEQITFTMASTKGGVIYTTPKGEFVVDGQAHEQKIAGSPLKTDETYVAVCKDSELQVIGKNKAGEVINTISMKISDKDGGVQYAQSYNGVSTTTFFKKVSGEVPTVTEEEQAKLKTEAEAQAKLDAVMAAAEAGVETDANAPKTEAATTADASVTTTVTAPTAVDPETHNPQDQPAQVPVTKDAGPGTPPPMPEPRADVQADASSGQKTFRQRVGPFSPLDL